MPYTALCVVNIILLITIIILLIVLVRQGTAYKQSKKDALLDHLTGAYNRRYLEKRLDEEVGRATRYKHPLLIIFIDVNNLKVINDQNGHKKGDVALITVARTLLNHLRQHDVVGRFGGDEFVLILPETTASTGELTVKRIIKTLSDIYIGDSPISVSVGIYSYNHKNSVDPIKAADQAMYVAKKIGKKNNKSAIHIYE